MYHKIRFLRHTDNRRPNNVAPLGTEGSEGIEKYRGSKILKIHKWMLGNRKILHAILNFS